MKITKRFLEKLNRFSFIRDEQFGSTWLELEYDNKEKMFLLNRKNQSSTIYRGTFKECAEYLRFDKRKLFRILNQN